MKPRLLLLLLLVAVGCKNRDMVIAPPDESIAESRERSRQRAFDAKRPPFEFFSAVDGDTIKVNSLGKSLTLRLEGIDAP